VIARGPVGSAGPATGPGAPTNGGSSSTQDPEGYAPRFEAGTRPYAQQQQQQQPFSRRAPAPAGVILGGVSAPLADRYGYPNSNTLSIGPNNIASSSG